MKPHRRYQKEDVQGLLPRSKRPLFSPYQTDTAIEEAIISIRHQEPTWVARKIIRYLQDQGLGGLPAASTVTTILKRQNMTGYHVSEQLYTMYQAIH